MHAVGNLIKRRALFIYFLLTFAISWGGVLMVTGRGGFPATPEQIAVQTPFVYLSMLAGPSIACILLTSLVSGRAGFRQLLSRLLRWRVGIRWYLVALLATPLLALLTLLVLLPFSPVYLPGIFAAENKAAVLLTGMITGLIVAFFEELGWTGFAAPKMRERRGVLGSGLIIGLMWGLWHFILAFWASGSPSGAFSWALFLPWIPYNLAILPAYRVLMGWVYERTQSLLLAIFMHASLTGGLALTFMPLEISGRPNIIWYLLLAVVLWAVVAAVAMANGWHLSRQPVREQTA